MELEGFSILAEDFFGGPSLRNLCPKLTGIELEMLESSIYFTGVGEFKKMEETSYQVAFEDAERYFLKYSTAPLVGSCGEALGDLFVVGGPSSLISSAPPVHLEDRLPEKPDELGRSWDIAQVLVRCAGALEAILMLADVGPATSEQLIAEATGEENLLEVIAELHKYQLVMVRGKEVFLTETGRKVVEKLRQSRQEGVLSNA